MTANHLPPLPEPDHSLDGGTLHFYTAEQVEQIRREAVEADRRARLATFPSETQLRHILKEIPLCYPWGAGRTLVRDGSSLDWVSRRESTGSNTQLAEMNKNFVNSAIAATIAALANMQPADSAQLARQSQEPQAEPMSAADIETLFKKCGGQWRDGSYWVIEDADLIPFVRTAIAAAPAHPVVQPAPADQKERS